MGLSYTVPPENKTVSLLADTAGVPNAASAPLDVIVLQFCPLWEVHTFYGTLFPLLMQSRFETADIKTHV